MIHTLKTDPEVFQLSWDGTKLYEIRSDDRGFKVNDILLLVETAFSGEDMKAGKPLEYTGRAVYQEVIHKLKNQYGLQPGWCILGTKFMTRKVNYKPEDKNG